MNLERIIQQAAQASKEPPPVQVASPLNDIQVLCLLASQLEGSAAERVEFALDLMAEAIVQTKSDPLGRLVREKMAARQAIIT